MYESLQALMGGSLLTTISVYLPGYALPQRLSIPAVAAQVTLTQKDSPIAVPAYLNSDGTGVPIAQPLRPDADGRIAGYVPQPGEIDMHVSGPGIAPQTITIGFAHSLSAVESINGQTGVVEIPMVQDVRASGPITIDSSNVWADQQALALDAASGRLVRAQPRLAIAGLAPISGATMSLKEDNGMIDGVSNVEMSRVWIPTFDRVLSAKFIEATWMLRQGISADGGTAMNGVATVNPVTVSRAIETVDGRLAQLSERGRSAWTLEPSVNGHVPLDLVSPYVRKASGGFWLRSHVQVKPGGFAPANRHASNAVAGQLVVRYQIADLAASFPAAVAAIGGGPALYWALNQASKATDLSGHGRDGTGHQLNGPLVIGGEFGPFPQDGATRFDGSGASTVVSAYTPYVNGQPFSAVGIVKATPGTAQALFGAYLNGGPIHQPIGRIEANGNFTFRPSNAVAPTATWAIVWPASGWVLYCFYYNQSTGNAQLWINGVSQGIVGGLGAYDATVGPFMVGGSGDNGMGGHLTSNPLNGLLAHVAAFANYQITGADVAALFTTFVAASTDQTMATGPLGTTGSIFSGGDSAHLPVLLLGVPA